MADSYDSTKHDIGIKYSGTTYGLMLAQEDYESNGVKHTRPVYQTLIDEYIAEQQATGQPGYEHLPPEKELSFVQSSYRAGFGQEFYDPDDPERYYSSFGMCLRHKGHIKLSWGATAITTLPTTTDPTISNPGFEDWDNGNCDNWTLVDATLSKGTAGDKRTGTYSANLTVGDGHIWQNLSTTEIQGRRFTFSCWVKVAATGDGRIAINDGTTTWYSRFHSGGGTFEHLSVTATLGTSASRLRLMCVRTGTTVFFDDATITRTSYTNPTAHCFFNGINYVAFGGLLTKEDSNGDEFEAVYEFASPITDMKLFTDGYMYIAQESTTIIENCEDDWTDGAHASSDLDTGDYKVGSGSVKITGNGVVNGDIIAYEDFGSTTAPTDFSTFTGFTLWIKSSAAVAASDLALCLGNTSGAGDLAINLPALVAGVWTKVYARFADPTNAAITNCMSVGLEYNANADDTIIHIDDIRAESSYWYMNSGEVFTQSTLNVKIYDSFAKLFQPVGTTMWKHLPPHRIYSATDPSNTGAANWSGATYVDTPTFNITSLASDGSSLYIGKEDRAFYLTGAGAVAVLIEETQNIASSTSGKNMFVWQGKVYYPCGGNSLVEYDAGTITWRSPSKFTTHLTEFTGQIQAIAGDEEYLIIVTDNGSNTVEILFGRNEVIGGTTQWVWHPYQELTLTGGDCEIAFVVSDFQKRLYIGSTNSANSFYYMPLPVNYGDVIDDDNRSFADGGYFETSKIDFNFGADPKTGIKITVELGHSWDTLVYFECWIKVENGSYVDVGNLIGTADTRIDTLYFAANTTGRNFQLKFVGKTDDPDLTPILHWYDLRAILYPTRRNLIACTVRAADNMKDKLGNTMGTTAANIRTYLEAARDATYPVDFEDIWSTAKKVRVLALKSQPFSTVHKQAKGENIEEHFHLLLQEVQVS